MRRASLGRIILRSACLLYGGLVIISIFNYCSRCVVQTNSVYSNNDGFHSSRCSLDVDSLGFVAVDMEQQVSLGQVVAANTPVEAGGRWSPADCKAWQKVAIIIPYRNRWSHLKLLLHRLHPMLRKQKIHYQMFVIEQIEGEEFNRGRLLNIGVAEALKQQAFDCFIFQDVDLLPENDQNLYFCDSHVRHLASAINEVRYHVMYNNYAGGVVALNRQNFFTINGYSNDYWGWGSEDDDFSARTMAAGLQLSRPPESVGRYKMVRHVKQWRASDGYDAFVTWRSRWKEDGIGAITDKYKVEKLEILPLYTHILVNIGHAPARRSFEGVPKESLFWFLSFFFP